MICHNLIRALNLFALCTISVSFFGCANPPSDEHPISIKDSSQITSEDKHLIGNKYWFIPGGFMDGFLLCPTPADYKSECKPPIETVSFNSQWGPFIIRDVVEISPTFLERLSETTKNHDDPVRDWQSFENKYKFFVIETPEHEIRYSPYEAFKSAKQQFRNEDLAAKQAKSERDYQRNQEHAKAECRRKGDVLIGMTKRDIIKSCWGNPQRKNITKLASGVMEQWIYAWGYIYIVNDAIVEIQLSE